MLKYPWGKKANEDVSSKDKRSIILKDLREKEDLKELNRREAWARFRGKRKPMSTAQVRSGARKVV